MPLFYWKINIGYFFTPKIAEFIIKFMLNSIGFESIAELK